MNLRGQLRQFDYMMTVSELRRLGSRGEGEFSYHNIVYLDLIGYQAEQGGCTVSALAKTLRVSKPAVTSRVNELLARGLVIKTQSERDKRVFHLRPCEEFEQILREYDGSFERAVARVEREYSAEEIGHFCEILRTLACQITEDIDHANPSAI